jgi:hypothetical protein
MPILVYFLIWDGPYNSDTVQIDDVIKSSAKNTYSVIFSYVNKDGLKVERIVTWQDRSNC